MVTAVSGAVGLYILVKTAHEGLLVKYVERSDMSWSHNEPATGCVGQTGLAGQCVCRSPTYLATVFVGHATTPQLCM